MILRRTLPIKWRSLRNPRLFARLQSGQSRPPSVETETIRHPSVFIEEGYVRNTISAVDYFRRFLKYSVVGLLTVGVTTWTAFEGAHMWVENAELATDNDDEIRKWEWDIEAERWTGGPRGGTDRGLGFMGRHAVRSAWMAQHWGIGATGSGSVIGSNAFTGRGGSGAGGLNIVETRLELAQNFIQTALQVAEKRMASGKIRPETVTELLQRHASIMERMGTRDALFEARMEFERVWSQLPGKGVDAARTALKLGDINQRIGDREDAMSWWARAFHLLHEGNDKSLPQVPPKVPEALPSSPLAQRTLISALVSLSAHYATSGQLRQAQAIEEASLELLRSVQQPPSAQSTTPPQALHALYILHRSALLSIHLAEVLYGLRSRAARSTQWLYQAAESSERVALALTGLPSVHPDAPQSKIPHPPSSEAPLLSEYAKSLSMRKPAISLLRDARRTAAEAWSLLGLLAEATEAPGSMERALECYERALGWAGVSSDRAGGIGKPGEGTLQTEWNVLWSNYVRARNSLRKE
ncbi:hypothetical protein NLI96_g5927 [Meripilus lineatus]|uniref:Uncharacterized protein n=1 Tax=Meripilus lineatus TaxID=2056292 RepID=A0AAD5YIL9_9APHY|nr:hypothetical protein NLI96_g5927 [Physisporinus lineatus]